MISPLSSIGLSLLIFAATVQASSPISLGGNFQQLPFGITGECRTVYNLPIKDCYAEDFQSRSACSQACVLSLEKLSNTLNTVCPGVIVDSRTLLGLIFQNRLVQSVCNAIEAPSQSEAPASTTAKPANTSPPATTSQEPPQSTTTEAPPSTTSTEAPPKSLSVGLGDPDLTPNTTPVSTPTTIQVPQTTTSSKEEKPTVRSRLQEQIDANRFSGGGSPFDNIVPDSGAIHTGTSRLKSVVGALLVVVILIR
jgi:hypothetical protein